MERPEKVTDPQGVSATKSRVGPAVEAQKGSARGVRSSLHDLRRPWGYPGLVAFPHHPLEPGWEDYPGELPD